MYRELPVLQKHRITQKQGWKRPLKFIEWALLLEEGLTLLSKNLFLVLNPVVMNFSKSLTSRKKHFLLIEKSFVKSIGLHFFSGLTYCPDILSKKVLFWVQKVQGLTKSYQPQRSEFTQGLFFDVLLWFDFLLLRYCSRYENVLMCTPKQMEYIFPYQRYMQRHKANFSGCENVPIQ